MDKKIAKRAPVRKARRDEVLIDILARSRSVRDICLHLVHDIKLERAIRGAHIYNLNSRMELTLISSYGTWTSHVIKSTNLDEGSLVSLGLTEGKAVFVPAKTFDETSYASIPFIKNMIPNGVLVLVNPVNSLEKFFCVEDFKIFSQVASILLDFLPTQEQTIKSKSPGFNTFLSDRQIEVLEFMLKEQTNPQIARKLNLSESTIRQETMKIYRRLGVRNRQEVIAFYREKQKISADS